MELNECQRIVTINGDIKIISKKEYDKYQAKCETIPIERIDYPHKTHSKYHNQKDKDNACISIKKHNNKSIKII